MKRTALFLLAIPLLCASFWLSPDPLHIGTFSEADASQKLPSDWETLHLQDDTESTQYRLVRADSTVVIKATSDDQASGLKRRVEIDPREYPIIEWRWKAENVLKDGDVTEKDGDDYPARIYVTFDYDPSNLGFGDRLKYKALQVLGYDKVPLRAINYLWASNAPVDETVPNPFTDWVMMIPVESGCAHCHEWRTEQRNIYEDYQAAFGEKPPPINGVAIMTDTDNTGGAATAYYGDIVFRKQSKQSASSFSSLP